MNSESMSPDPFLEADVSTFKWTPEIERDVLLHMVNLKPFGVMKFMNISIIQEHIRNQHKISIPFTCMMEFINSKWHMEAADDKEISNLKISKKSFKLPDEYKLLVLDELHETKKKQVKYDSKDEQDLLNKIGTSSTKVSEIEDEAMPSIRRSLHSCSNNTSS